MDTVKKNNEEQWVYLTGREIYNFISMVKGKLKGLHVYALVGKSGTGKSFRARLLAEKLDVGYIIDDGLLIHKETILAGRSAKQERHYITAIKTALFMEESLRADVIEALKKHKIKKILLLGTSVRMVEQMAKNLQLPPISQIIRIEEIASQKDIEAAIKSRMEEGKHVIPVPAIEIERDYAQILSDSIRIFFSWDKRGAGKKKSKFFEKSIVQPNYLDQDAGGKVTITEAAITQMILHCIDEFDDSIAVKKVKIRVQNTGYAIGLHITIDYGKNINTSLDELRNYICNTIHRYTGITIQPLTISVDEIAMRKQSGV
ncbi:MAG: hypothetical protein CSA20_00410 [Deltaproteobacteria bacterium]|nr:MAG: hypothetical protein CSA20_00410 [Deltaproteobacteria bacterium]